MALYTVYVNTYVCPPSAAQNAVGAVVAMTCEKALVIVLISLYSSWHSGAEAVDGESGWVVPPGIYVASYGDRSK